MTEWGPDSPAFTCGWVSSILSVTEQRLRISNPDSPPIIHMPADILTLQEHTAPLSMSFRHPAECGMAPDDVACSQAAGELAVNRWFAIAGA